jgi:hypothetical protein
MKTKEKKSRYRRFRSIARVEWSMGVKLERDSGRGFGLKFPHQFVGRKSVRNASGLIGGRPLGPGGRVKQSARLGSFGFRHRLTGHRIGW